MRLVEKRMNNQSFSLYRSIKLKAGRPFKYSHTVSIKSSQFSLQFTTNTNNFSLSHITLQYRFVLPSIPFIPYFKLHRSLQQQTYSDICLLLPRGVLLPCLPTTPHTWYEQATSYSFKPITIQTTR